MENLHHYYPYTLLRYALSISCTLELDDEQPSTATQMVAKPRAIDLHNTPRVPWTAYNRDDGV